MRTNIILDENLTKKAFDLTGLKTNGLCDAFENLHQLKLNTDPFPDNKRTNRVNPFKL